MFQAKWKNNSKATRPTYSTWVGMRQRCSNPSHTGYANYGARGITVCDRWINNYDAFVEDMGFRPDGYSIERINNDKGYTPENCRWATASEQSRNTRKSRKIHGKNIADLADAKDVPRTTVYSRLDRGIKDKTVLLAKSLVPEPKHGTLSMYVGRKCRCEDCRKANAEYMRQNRHRFRSVSPEYRRMKYRERQFAGN